jgi:tRNA 2-thiouridine synthesizing protein B
MATLHIVSRQAALASCLATAGAGDTVLLIEDGVYASTRATPGPVSLVALEPDVRARGLAGRMAPGVGLATDARFVELVVSHQPVVTWR